MAQLIKNLPAMWETWVQSLGWEDSLEKGTTTHSSILAWRIPWAWGHKELDTTERLSPHYYLCMCAYTPVQCMHTSVCLCTYILFLGGLAANSLDRRMDSVLERQNPQGGSGASRPTVSSSYLPKQPNMCWFSVGAACLYADQNSVLGIVVAQASWGFQAHLDVPERAGEC